MTRDHQYEPHLVQIIETSKIIHYLVMLWLCCSLREKFQKLYSNKNCSELKINLSYNLNLDSVLFPLPDGMNKC